MYIGYKTIRANRLYQFLHPTSASIGIETVPSTPSLFSFFQQLNKVTLSISGNTFSNNSPSTDNVTPDANKTLSATFDLVAYTDQQPPTTTNYHIPMHHYLS